MFIYSDGEEIGKWKERNYYGERVEVYKLPPSLGRIFKRPGRYTTLGIEDKSNPKSRVAKFKIEPSDFYSYPAQYVSYGTFICKAFLKVLTGKTKITEPTTVSVRIAFVRPLKEDE